MVEKVDKIWFDGELVNWDDANVHVLTHTLHYGVGVFEGIRAYKTHDGRKAIFRLDEHIERFIDSAKIMMMDMPYSHEELMKACVDTFESSGLEECYLRPLAFMGDGEMGLGATSNATRVCVIVWKWGAYLGDEGIRRGIRAKVSSFTRSPINSLMAKGKVVGHYVNSILAKREVKMAGYDEAIMLDPQGYVCEASGANIFMVKKGKVVTPPLGGSILGGITRDSCIEIIRELGIPLEERAIARDELYIADEIFLCGTAAEVTPVREVDDRQVGVGERGPIAKQVQDRYFEVVRANNTERDWFTYVD